jgi:hypothetical protein
MNNNYIQHWGILGQKWGVRRYQNEDGTLTEEGRLRYRVDSKGKMVKLTKAEQVSAVKAKKIEDDKKKPLTQRNISTLSNTELKEYIARMTDEKLAYSLKSDINKLNPKQKTIGDKIVDKLVEQLPGMLIDTGKQYLQEYIKKQSKTEDPAAKELKRLKQEAERTKNLKDILSNQKAIEKLQNGKEK